MELGSEAGMRKLILITCLFLSTSCSYGAKFIDQAGKRPAYGDYNTFTKNITVTLPSGERFKGRYFPLDANELGSRQGSLFSRVDISTYLGLTGLAEGWKDWHAFLKGDRGATLEVIFRYNSSQNHGYGAARTDNGAEYRVTL